jgi:hypothetical protein
LGHDVAIDIIVDGPLGVDHVIAASFSRRPVRVPGAARTRTMS